MRYQNIIFDLDGVICHTDAYHYQAWKALADRLGIYFDEEMNNRFRGVSRMDCLEMLLKNYDRELTDNEKKEFAEEKNNTYRKLLENMSPADLSPEVSTTLDALRRKEIRMAIGSSSKNAKFILERIGLGDYFDALRVCDFALKNTYEMGRSIAGELNKLGCSISRKNAEYLAELCLCNTAFVKQEIKKLADYSGSGEITKETIDLLCIKHVESDGYSLAMNIVRSRADLVFARLDELSQQNYEPFEILGIISFSVSDMLRAKLARSSSLNISDVVSDFDYPKNREFAVKNMYNDCANISLNRIKSILEILSDTDLTLKTHSSGKSSDMLTLEQGIARCMALRN